MKQNTQHIILGLAILVLISSITFTFFWKPKQTENFAILNSASSESQTKTSGGTDTGDVEISLTPIQTSNQLTIKIAANTHSVDLSQFNLQKQTTLEAEGKTYKPISSPSLSGHHSSGNIVFNTNTNLKNFKIIIQGIPKTNQRTFSW